MKRISTCSVLLFTLFTFVTTLTYGQNKQTFHSVTGTLVRVTPKLADIDPNSMYGAPFRITRDMNGIIGISDRGEEKVEEQMRRASRKGASLAMQSPGIIYPNSPIPTSGLNFDGQSWSGFDPSDNNMAAGPNHVIQIINNASGSSFKIWNKSTGAVVQNAMILSAVTGLSGAGDPVVIYDQLADRWVLAEFGPGGCCNQLIMAVSATSNPTGAWNIYQYTDPTFFPDYPKFSVWHNAYYAYTNDFNTAGTSYLGSSIYAFDRAAMIAGAATATMVRFRQTGAGNPFYNMGSVCLEGSTPSSQNGLFIYPDGGSNLGIFEFTPNFANPPASVVGPVSFLPIALYSQPPAQVAQQGSGNTLGSLGSRMMFRLNFRNRGGIETIVATHTVRGATSTQAAVRWYELRRVAGNWTVYQQGTLANADGNSRWMGGISMDDNGNIGLMYDVAGPTAFPSVKYTGRDLNDPLGTMTLAEQTIINGTVPHTIANRWGDYNTLVSDPTVVGSFWGTSQYNNNSTRVFNFSLAQGLPMAVIAATSSTITAESCSPSNGVIDPNETVTVNLCLQNIGSLNTTNLVATLLPTGGVTAPSAPQNYGAVPMGGAAVCRNFTFTANGICGGNVVASLQLQDGATNVGTITYNFTLGTLTASFSQNFDAVAVPALPAGWVTSQPVNTAGILPWQTSNSGTPTPVAASLPNSIFTNDGTNVSENIIETPSIAIVSAAAKLSFSNNYNTEPTWDGGVLEISINGGAYQDIITAGGSFASGGYTGILDNTSQNPIRGRNAWTGNSGGFITTLVNLPATAAGQNIKIRFRMGSDESVGAPGWRVDNVVVSEPSCCAGCSPVSVSTQPANTTVCAGSNATFTVTAGGSAPNYQWQVSTTGVGGPYTNLTNAPPYSGVTTATLNITGATAAMNGYYYRVVLNNACPSTATSNSALLTVTASSSPVITQQPANTAACTGANATFTSTATGANLSYQWQVSTNGGGTFTNISGANSSSYTVTAVTAAMNNYQYRVIVTGGCPSTNTTTSNAAVLTVNSSNLAVTGNPAPQTVCAGANASFSVTATGTGLTYQWQVSTNGGGTYTDIPGATANPLVLTGVTIGMNNNLYRVIVKGTGTCDPATGVISAGALLTVQTSPAITAQPIAVTGCPGSSATFSVTATGTNLTYQWQSSATGCSGTFTNIPGAQSASYNIPSTTAAMNGTGYRVVVSGACTPAQTSNCVLLNVGSGITILNQPVSTTVCAGATAAFTVNATGGTVIYQWQVSTDGGATFIDVTGANANTLTLPGVTAAMNNNQYHVLISNTCTPAITSNNVTLTVQTAAAITTQPTAISACTGSSAALSVVATGTNITYQWQSAPGGCGGTFTNIPGATGASYSPPTATAGTTGYRVIVSGVCTPASVTSNCVTVTLGQTTVINTQPASVTACAGNNTSFSVTATGATSYQWQVSTNGGISFTDISGANTPTLNLTAVTTAMSGNQYRVLINGCPSTVTSNAATLTIQSAPAITSQPTDINTCATSATFTVVATGTGIQYQWQVSTDGGITYTNIAGANSATLTLPNLTTAMANYKYRVVVSAASCVATVTSNAVTAKVGVTPVIVLTAAPVTAYNPYVTGGVYTTVSPVGNYIYQWTRDGVVIPGLTATSLTAANGLLLAFGTYQVKVTDPVTGCSGLSNTITITDIAQGRTQLFISPNPTNGIIHISYYNSTTAAQARQVGLYDSKGAKLMNKAFSVSGAYGTMDMDLSNMSRGTYMVILRDASGNKIASERVVKL